MTDSKWLVLLTALLMTGCAGMDKSQCLTADWRTIGFEDGANGKPETAIATYRQECADHGVTPELNAYRLGHRAGSERFCTRVNGFNVGKRGASYQNSCMPDLEADFLPGYRDGKTLYDLQRGLNSARSAAEKQHRLISALEQDIVSNTELLVADGLSREERVQLLYDIEMLKSELDHAINLLPALEHDAHLAEQAYIKAEQRLRDHL
ncbi:DUF2799 domain-containing protein [Arsukibacterium sp.]|uniref:DUF2799 domain-containing protein n=1 Tax=Arsukibacterium sp. TaxID=1977258 RepID=UPI0035678E3C